MFGLQMIVHPLPGGRLVVTDLTNISSTATPILIEIKRLSYGIYEL